MSPLSFDFGPFFEKLVWPGAGTDVRPSLSSQYSPLPTAKKKTPHVGAMPGLATGLFTRHHNVHGRWTPSTTLPCGSPTAMAIIEATVRQCQSYVSRFAGLSDVAPHGNQCMHTSYHFSAVRKLAGDRVRLREQ